MIFFTENPMAFITGTFFTIQSMAGLPPLPAGKTAIGQGYKVGLTEASAASLGLDSDHGLPVLVTGHRGASIDKLIDHVM
jgi:hypothetical protein